MISINNERKTLDFFKKKKIATILQISSLLNCSIPSVRQRLKKWEVYNSYNHNGVYYALPEVIQFDKNNLWEYKSIRFSKYGTLKQTVVYLISNSEMGLDASEIGKTVKLSPRSFMSHFKNIPGIKREKHEGRFIYFSDKKSVYIKQKRKRESVLKEKLLSLPSDTVAIAILIDIIKHPNTAIENCIQRLRIKKINIKRETIQKFLQHHNIKKNSGYELLTTFKQYINKIVKNISAEINFKAKPILPFASEFDNCPACNKILLIHKNREKTAATLSIGMFKVRETILVCPQCNTIFFSKKLRKLIPFRCTFGFDILVYVGKKFFLHSYSTKEIHYQLKKRNIKISENEINYLAKKFIIYLSIAHKQSEKKLKKFMYKNGGYILHIDATCENNSPFLLSGLDGITEIVLKNVKIPTEKAKNIIPFLQKIKQSYGNPVALVHDMGKGILAAVKKIFPGIKDYICHMHFLRDIGKDLFGDENDIIRKCLSRHGISGLLHKRASIFKNVIEKNEELIECIVDSLEKKKLHKFLKQHKPIIACYILILWALDGKNQGQGYGFPFDRPYLVFYQRLKTIYSYIKKWKKIKGSDKNTENKSFIKTIEDLKNVLNDSLLKKVSKKMEEKVKVFDKLREAMRIALPHGTHGINDDGDADIKTIEKKVKNFYDWLCDKETKEKKRRYEKMIDQLKKYWEKLFTDPVIVYRAGKKIIIQPQRTNNILERLFRDWKRSYRKRGGTSPSNKTIKGMIAETPLVKNLTNQDYMNIILNGKENLEERFAEIDTQLVREELLNAQKDVDKIPFKIKKIIKKPKLFQCFLHLL